MGGEFSSFNSMLIILFDVDPVIVLVGGVVGIIVVCLHRVRAVTVLYNEIR